MIFQKYQKYHDIFYAYQIFLQFYLCITSNKLFNPVYPDNSVFADYYHSFVRNNAKLAVL